MRSVRIVIWVFGSLVTFSSVPAYAAPRHSTVSGDKVSDKQGRDLPEYITAQAPMLNDLGNLLLDRVGHDGGDTLLYVELDGKAVYGAIFHDRGAFVDYTELDDGLLDPVLDLWRLPPKDKRWIAFQYTLKAGRFHFTAFYPEDIRTGEGVKDRIDRIGTEAFGKKPVRYPSGAGKTLH